MLKRILLPVVLLLGLQSTLLAQPLSEWLKAAETSYAKQDYYSAYRYYEVAIKYDTTRMDFWYKMGESARNFTAYNTAGRAYERVAQSNQRDSFPLLPFRQAQVQQSIGNFEYAAELYQEFLASDPADVDPDILEEAERNRINSEWAIDIANRPKDVPVSHVPGEVNSPDNDFAPYYKGDTLFFSSLRFNIKKDSILPRRSLARVMWQNAASQEVKTLPETVNPKHRLAAHTTFNEAENTVYYTICDYQGGTTELRCDIYSAPVDKQGKWGAPTRLPLNAANATNTHPNVGVYPETGDPVLYFSSDRDGGKGGLDIYYSALLPNGECGPVQALANINTDGDDVTPFYYAPNQSIYFATDGRLTMGGFDIYRVSWNGRDWNRPSHMGVPVNSSYNDLYYSRFPERERAYFASNRPDSLAIFWDDSKDACCNDIYSIGITDEIRLLALTYDKRTNEELPATSVALYEIGPDGSRLLDSIYNPTSNDFAFTALLGKKYELVAYKPDYTTDRDTVDLNDPALANETEIERKLYLMPGLKLDVFTFNQIDSTALAGTTVYLYEITPEGERILVDSLVNPSANDFHFTLERGKKYQVYAQKDGYSPTDVVVDTNDPELVEATEIRRDLYLEPGLFLEVYTFKLLDETPLAGTTVYLYEYTDADGEVLVDSITNPNGHQFGFLVERGKQYVIKGSKKGYGPDLASLDLTGSDVPDKGTFRRDLYLGQLLEIYTFDKVTKLPLPGAEVRLLDPETLDPIAEKINPEGNDFRFSINLDVPYLLEVTRKGYAPVKEIITFSPDQLEAGGGKIVFDVELVPFDDPDSMLPLVLYFDNDHPDPDSYSRTTNAEYFSTNVSYYEQQQNFIQSFTSDLPLEEAFRLRRRYQDFFQREVRGGSYDLEEFSKRLLVYLESGKSYNLELLGFASPRAPSDYNVRLSQRRIQSVINTFNSYQDGAFLTYIKNGQLTFTRDPKGESTADKRITDRLDDEKNSIYGIQASLERRVELRPTRTDDN